MGKRGFTRNRRVFRKRDPERIEVFEIQFDKYSSDLFFVNAAIVDVFCASVVDPDLNLKGVRSWDGTWFWRIANSDRKDSRWRANDVIDSPKKLLASIDSAIDQFKSAADHLGLLDELLEGANRTGACRLFSATVWRAKVAVALTSKLKKPELRDQAEVIFRDATTHWPEDERSRFLDSWP